MRAVARAAGIAPQSVYLQFADRRDLLTAVYQARFGELYAALVATGDRADDAPGRLAAICRAYIDYGQEHPGHYRVLFGTAGTPGWEPTTMPGIPTWQLLVDAAAGCGSTDPTATAACLWAGMHGLITLRQDRPSFAWPDLDVLVDTLLSAHLAASRGEV